MENQCTATAKSTGERCQRPAIKGGSVCYQHGGAAPQVQEKAQERLDQMADSTTATVQSQIEDLEAEYEAAEDPEQKLDIMREIRQLWKIILDRTGHGPTSRREVTGPDGESVDIAVSSEVVTVTDDDE